MDEQITTLEDELARVQAELEAERQQQSLENSETRERDRQEFIECEKYWGTVGRHHEPCSGPMCEEKKALMDVCWE